MKYRADIGGLRALAIVSVVLFHFKVPGFSGGFSGVDIFFVISGYLMSCIFLTKVDLGIAGVFSFYKSRFIRIYPALISMIVISYLALSIAGANGWLLDYYNEAKHSLTFISNIFYSSHSGYFDAAADNRWLLHTWSLSVEWQFYIIFPPIVFAATKIINKNKMWCIYIPLFLISLSVCLFAFDNNQNNTFYSLSSRAWELFAGAIISTIKLKSNNKHKKTIEALGISIILLSVLLLNNTNWPNTYTLLPVLGCALVILSSIENNKSLLRWWPLQKIGDISYSLYLWHWIVCAYMTNADINFTAKNIAIAIFVSTFAAIISYNYFERWKVGGVKAFLGTSIVAIGCMATVNAHIIDSSKKSLSSSYSGKDLDKQFTHDCFITSGTKSYDEFKQDKCLKISTDKKNILLFGDSMRHNYPLP
jgi:peptidoglycan/LPS O-acetylase OafA/YrhL